MRVNSYLKDIMVTLDWSVIFDAQLVEQYHNLIGLMIITQSNFFNKMW